MDKYRRQLFKAAGLCALGLTGCTPSRESLRESIRQIMDDPDFMRSVFADGEYDNNDMLVDSDTYRDLVEGAVPFYSWVKYKETDTGDAYSTKTIGSGFLKGESLVTVNHIFEKTCVGRETKKGYKITPVKMLDAKAYYDIDGLSEPIELSILYQDRENDLAVINFPYGTALEFKWGDSDDLRVGNLVSVAGTPLATTKMLRKGTVGSENSNPLFGMDDIDDAEIFLSWGMLMPGDSGTPVYAFRDGEPEIVGMALTSNNYHNECHKINHIREVLKGRI